MPNSVFLGQTMSVIMEICQKMTLMFKVTGIDTDLSATYDQLLVIHGNHGPISYRF